MELRRSSALAVIALALVAPCVHAIPAGDTRLLRFPAICGDTIAFVYAGDIYTVGTSGGTALRLTSHEGRELYPRFSPDCRQIAFSGEYDGTRQVYVIPAGGGSPRQLTWYNDVGAMPPRGGTDNRVLGWTPDGRNVVVRMNRVATDERAGRPYLVPVDGGMETPLAIPESGGGTLSPDGKQFVYTPIDRDFRSWKRYRGGRAPDVWTYDLEHDTSRQLTADRASNTQPMWIGDTIYFTSDRDGSTVNLYAMPATGGEARALTRFTDFDVLWPSASTSAIVFENGGAIWRYDVASGNAAAVPIRVTGDFPQTVPGWKNVAGQVESFDIAADGRGAVFAARGELFRLGGKQHELRNLANTPDAREMAVSLSPDGQRIAYLSDASGEYELYVRGLDGSGERRVTHDGGIWRFAPVWSPDGHRLAYADKLLRLRIVDVDGGRTREVDQSRYGEITEYAWSPDGQWLAYTLENEAHLSRVWLYSLKNGTRSAVTAATSSASNPVFDPQGRWLYFLSNRDFALTFSAYEQNYLYTNATRIYALSLAADGPVPYRDADATPAPSETKPAKQTALRVDVDGMIGREQVLKTPNGNYQSLAASANALFYLTAGDRLGGPGELRMLALDADKDATIARGVTAYSLAADGGSVLAQQGDKFAILEAKPDQDFAKNALDLSRMQVLVDPAREWRQEFTDAWRILRDWFYDAGMHGGLDRWNAVRERYAALVPYVATRQDLDYLLQELAGELNSGHVYVQPGDEPKLERHPGGLLGAEIVADASGYFRIARIFPGESWTAKARSPLADPGVRVKAGEYLLAVDGVDARSVKNFYQLLQNKGDREVVLRVGAQPREAGSREVRVRTLTSDLGPRYLDWVAAKRALVDRLSGGRIGYIHLPNTAVEGNRELFKGMLAYADKDALIIDDRYNGGGFIPDRMIELLARTPLNYWKRRGQEPESTPLLAHAGPKAMLINGLSSSGGDALPYYFRQAGLGPLIGTRTWGGLIGISGNPSLADGGAILAATFRFMDRDGRWAVENEGVAPDIEVIDRPEAIAAGRDPSIEKAVEVLLDTLARKPRKPVVAPPAPSDFTTPVAH